MGVLVAAVCFCKIVQFIFIMTLSKYWDKYFFSITKENNVKQWKQFPDVYTLNLTK